MSKALVWIRRDIRTYDHPALAKAIEENEHVYLCFIFDPDIIEPLKRKSTADKRLQFIAESLVEFIENLPKTAGITIRYGEQTEEIPKLIDELKINALYFNRDYTPYARKRDKTIADLLKKKGVKVHSFKDIVIFEPEEIRKSDNDIYKVFTPYSKTWLAKFEILGRYIKPFNVQLEKLRNDIQTNVKTVKDMLDLIGLHSDPNLFPGGTKEALKRLRHFEQKINNYDYDRDFISKDATSTLSVYIRHGCISIRDMVNTAIKYESNGAFIWLKELIWREFYQMIAYEFPHVGQAPFKESYQNLTYPGTEDYLKCWKEGQTGFPIIDAAMRCLNETGWMHNRLRMIVASFLSKILLVDWKRGERYFSWKLIDYEMPANNGGWQWSSGSGCDAAPYFRIFNPTTQSKKFDPEGEFIRQWCPELQLFNKHDIHCPSEAKRPPHHFKIGTNYPKPIVDYSLQRKRALAFYANV